MSDAPIQTNLSNRMRQFAQDKPAAQLPAGWLRAAEKFDETYKGFYLSNPQTATVAQFLGAYARARRMWCEATGETLV